VVFVHGFPDTRDVWDLALDRLTERFRCVAYDVRGAGASDAPRARADYSLPHLVTDLVAVLDRFSPDGPAHLVGHDWGSVQAWEAVLSERLDPRLTGRIASFTSISGPTLGGAVAFAAAAWHGGWAARRRALHQAARSWYVYVFQVPLLPELLLRRWARRILRAQGRSQHFAATLPRDAANGVNLYRANFRRPPRPSAVARTRLPVQLVVPLRDRFLIPELAATAALYAADLTRTDLDAGHWVQRSHPDEVATCIESFVNAIESRRRR
jgi:pimeloyl-ACP methyl ester carboxylesterase